jgi:hypothetical protein
MSNAPERIWACASINNKSGVVTLMGNATFPVSGWQDYTRTDLIAAMIDEAVQAEREAIAASIEEMIQEEKRTLTPAHWLMTKADQDALIMLASIVAAIRARKGGEA